MIADSFLKKLRMRSTKGPWVNITKFVYGNLPDHVARIGVIASRHVRNSQACKVFPIWNGDNARHGESKAGIISDIEHYRCFHRRRGQTDHGLHL